MKRVELAGKRFGRLVALEKVGAGNTIARWKCRCDCGADCEVRAANLVNGHTQSCGCLQRERTSETKTVHGHYHGPDGKRSKLYGVWNQMKQRCQNTRNGSYENCGGRGITVCDEWQDFRPFRAWALVNGYREGLSIDRIDNDGDYEPSNCRWTDRTAQAVNRRSAVFLTYDGRTLPIREWAEETGIEAHILRQRLRRGWTAHRVLTQPVRRPNSATN